MDMPSEFMPSHCLHQALQAGSWPNPSFPNGHNRHLPPKARVTKWKRGFGPHSHHSLACPALPHHNFRPSVLPFLREAEDCVCNVGTWDPFRDVSCPSAIISLL
ncbi:hypothetical protein V6N11_011149 [Hibiscus sabdariffa]|uniref:Uncharacterized protein n=1 Tax=Hibiscus sabdariffa TaxID=183260 RepID=A0ABR2S7J8_9ROSI